jgi:hypothetical protein
MSPKQWFLIRMQNGRAEIYSQMFETYDLAKKCYDDLESCIGIEICETIYG